MLLFFSNILRKSSWKNVDTIVDSSFVMDTVADISLGSIMVVVECLFFLLLMSGIDASFSMS